MLAAVSDDASQVEYYVDRIAQAIEGIDLATVRRDFPGWRVWWSETSGCYHAMRRDGRFTQSQASTRRFHVAAVTVERLAVFLIYQALADQEEIQAAVE